MKAKVLAVFMVLALLITATGCSTKQESEDPEWDALVQKYRDFNFTYEEFETGFNRLTKDSKFKLGKWKKTIWDDTEPEEDYYCLETTLKIEGETERIDFEVRISKGKVADFEITYSEEGRELVKEFLDTVGLIIDPDLQEGKSSMDKKKFYRELNFDYSGIGGMFTGKVVLGYRYYFTLFWPKGTLIPKYDYDVMVLSIGNISPNSPLKVEDENNSTKD